MANAQTTPQEIAALYASLRRSFRRLFTRTVIGGVYVPRICPGCQQDRRGLPFIVGLCETCFVRGRPYPATEAGILPGGSDA